MVLNIEKQFVVSSVEEIKEVLDIKIEDFDIDLLKSKLNKMQFLNFIVEWYDNNHDAIQIFVVEKPAKYLLIDTIGTYGVGDRVYIVDLLKTWIEESKQQGLDDILEKITNEQLEKAAFSDEELKNLIENYTDLKLVEI